MNASSNNGHSDREKQILDAFGTPATGGDSQPDDEAVASQDSEIQNWCWEIAESMSGSDDISETCARMLALGDEACIWEPGQIATLRVVTAVAEFQEKMRRIYRAEVARQKAENG